MQGELDFGLTQRRGCDHELEARTLPRTVRRLREPVDLGCEPLRLTGDIERRLGDCHAASRLLDADRCASPLGLDLERGFFAQRACAAKRSVTRPTIPDRDA